MPKTLKSRGRNKTKKKSTHIHPARERWRRSRHSFSKFFLIIFLFSANFSWIAKSGQRQVHVTLFVSLFRCWQWNCKSWILFVCLLLWTITNKNKEEMRDQSGWPIKTGSVSGRLCLYASSLPNEICLQTLDKLTFEEQEKFLFETSFLTCSRFNNPTTFNRISNDENTKKKTAHAPIFNSVSCGKHSTRHV